MLFNVAILSYLQKFSARGKHTFADSVYQIMQYGTRSMCRVNNLSKVVATWQRAGQESNLWPLDHKSNVRPTEPPSHACQGNVGEFHECRTVVTPSLKRMSDER